MGSLNSMLLHAYVQGAGRKAQDRCGPVLTLDLPVSRLEGPHDAVGFGLGKRPDSGDAQTQVPGFRKRVHQAKTGAPGGKTSVLYLHLTSMGKESPCEEFTGGTFYVLYVNKK